MKKDEILVLLTSHREEMAEFGVKSLSVFGSVARDEAVIESDIDLLVEFDPEVHIGLFAFARLRRRLSELLGKKVDLVTPDAIRPEMREEIIRESVRAA